MRFLRRFVLSAAVLFFRQALQAQQPPAPPQEAPAPSAKSNSETHSNTNKKNTKPIPSFLIIGTVFDERALSFPGVQVRIRRAGETKYEWETYTNTRGEFAVRVPPGYDYEVLVHIKKYKNQTRSVNSKADVQQRLSIQLEPVPPPKTGAKS